MSNNDTPVEATVTVLNQIHYLLLWFVKSCFLPTFAMCFHSISSTCNRDALVDIATHFIITCSRNKILKHHNTLQTSVLFADSVLIEALHHVLIGTSCRQEGRAVVFGVMQYIPPTGVL